MKKAWIKNGKLMLDENKRVILCDECPCDCVNCETFKVTLSGNLEVIPSASCCGSGENPPRYIFSGSYLVAANGVWQTQLGSDGNITYDAVVESYPDERSVVLAVRWYPGGCSSIDAAWLKFYANDKLCGLYENYWTNAACGSFNFSEDFSISLTCESYGE